MIVLADEQKLVDMMRQLDPNSKTVADAQQAVDSLRAVYTSIGQYVAEFSQLETIMRTMIARHLSATQGQNREIFVTIAPMMFNQVANAFFSLCRESGNLSDSESQVESKLRGAASKAAHQRNDFLHGLWLADSLTLEPENSPRKMTLTRIKPERTTGAVTKSEFSPEQIDETAAGIRELRTHIGDFGDLSLRLDLFTRNEGIHRVSDVLEIRDGAVVRILEENALT